MRRAHQLRTWRGWVEYLRCSSRERVDESVSPFFVPVDLCVRTSGPLCASTAGPLCVSERNSSSVPLDNCAFVNAALRTRKSQTRQLLTPTAPTRFACLTPPPPPALNVCALQNGRFDLFTRPLCSGKHNWSVDTTAMRGDRLIMYKIEILDTSTVINT